MKRNNVMWGIVALVILTTISVSVGISDRRSQATSVFDGQAASTPPKRSITPPDFTKYASVDYDAAPEGLTAEQIEERTIKNKRYDVSLPVMPNPPVGADGMTGHDVEPDTPALPSDQSRLVVVGRITSSKAFLSNEKKGIYTEYVVNVEQILKHDKGRRLKSGEILTVDRAGGVVNYPNGQRILYKNAGRDLPEASGRFLLFLANDEPGNPNYKIVTAYRFKDGKVTAVDTKSEQVAFNGRPEVDFISLVSSKQKQEMNHDK